MSPVKYIVSNYLKVLGVAEQTTAEMLMFLSEHPGYPSLRSIVECFEEWQFESTAAEITIKELKDLGNFFIAFTNTFNGTFILVISTQEYQLIYLNAKGEIICETYEEFSKKWNHVIFIAELRENSGLRRKVDLIEKTPSPNLLTVIRSVAFNQEESPTYKLFRHGSVHISYLFIRLRISQNVATVLWLFAILASGYYIAKGPTLENRLLAITLVLMHFLFDCADGEIARATKSTSQYGSNLEQLFHWITNATLIIAASLGQFAQTKNEFFLKFGLFCLASDSLFHFYYIQLNYWLDDLTDYGWFYKISSTAYQFMPLNINLFLLSCLIGHLELFLIGWAIVSFVLFGLLFIGYFRKGVFKRKI